MKRKELLHKLAPDFQNHSFVVFPFLTLYFSYLISPFCLAPWNALPNHAHTHTHRTHNRGKLLSLFEHQQL